LHIKFFGNLGRLFFVSLFGMTFLLLSSSIQSQILPPSQVSEIAVAVFCNLCEKSKDINVPALNKCLHRSAGQEKKVLLNLLEMIVAFKAASCNRQAMDMICSVPPTQLTQQTFDFVVSKQQAVGSVLLYLLGKTSKSHKFIVVLGKWIIKPLASILIILGSFFKILQRNKINLLQEIKVQQLASNQELKEELAQKWTQQVAILEAMQEQINQIFTQHQVAAKNYHNLETRLDLVNQLIIALKAVISSGFTEQNQIARQHEQFIGNPFLSAVASLLWKSDKQNLAFSHEQDLREETATLGAETQQTQSSHVV